MSAQSAIHVGTTGDGAVWITRQFEQAPVRAGVWHEYPDLTVAAGRSYLTWNNSRVVFADNESGAWQKHTFNTPGWGPRLAASSPREFVAWTTPVHPGPGRTFAAEREGTPWSGAYASPETTSLQRVADTVAHDGKAAVLMVSRLRLYVRTQQ